MTTPIMSCADTAQKLLDDGVVKDEDLLPVVSPAVWQVARLQVAEFSLPEAMTFTVESPVTPSDAEGLYDRSMQGLTSIEKARELAALALVTTLVMGARSRR